MESPWQRPPLGMRQALNYLSKPGLSCKFDLSSINEFLHNIDNISAPDEASDGPPLISWYHYLFNEDQKSANSVKREMQNLSAKNWNANQACLSV